MKNFSIWFFIVCLTAIAAQAQSSKSRRTAPPPTLNVSRPAPEFFWSGVNGQVRRSRDLRGHPVILIFAERPLQKMFIRQVKELNRRSKKFFARYTLFFVAFTKETGLITRTDIPFVILPDPQAVADQYRVGDFGIAIINPEGSVDYATDRVITGQRALDVVINSFGNQVNGRHQ